MYYSWGSEFLRSWYCDWSVESSDGRKTPFSVIIPVISLAGVTSNAGFQHVTPEIIIIQFLYTINVLLKIFESLSTIISTT